jgi:predicted lysophospholipase L1 biosynthesis ABC-type transport system permease subunit
VRLKLRGSVREAFSDAVPDLLRGRLPDESDYCAHMRRLNEDLKKLTFWAVGAIISVLGIPALFLGLAIKVANSTDFGGEVEGLVRGFAVWPWLLGVAACLLSLIFFAVGRSIQVPSFYRLSHTGPLRAHLRT